MNSVADDQGDFRRHRFNDLDTYGASAFFDIFLHKYTIEVRPKIGAQPPYKIVDVGCGPFDL
jgi:hypothetical protein